MDRIASIRSRFKKHFPSHALVLDDISYVEDGSSYLCGVSEESPQGAIVRCAGVVDGKAVEYTFTIKADWDDNVTDVTLLFSQPVAVDVTLQPQDHEMIARPSAFDVGKAAGCITLAGGKSAYECWHRCKRDKKCWRDCAKEKGVTLGLEILGCLALT